MGRWLWLRSLAGNRGGDGTASGTRWANVIVHYNQGAERARTVVQAIEQAGGQAVALQADLQQLEPITELFAQAEKHYARLDILVNNAAVAAPVPLDAIDLDHYKALFQVNVRAVLFCTQAAARRMEAGGRIINVSSGAAQSAPAGLSVYSATKAALEALTKSHAAELGPRGITVNAVSPGLTETEMLQTALTPQYRDQMIAQTPLGRLGQPDDIADVIAFLASDQARWITGQVVRASGGLR